MNGKNIRLGGYPVPLETDAKGRSTLFFLVPYPGACRDLASIGAQPPRNPVRRIIQMLDQSPRGLLAA